MKISILALFIFAFVLNCSEAQSTTQSQVNVPAPTPYTIVDQDANSRVWQREEYEAGPNGQIVTNLHSYTELASGLNHFVNGQWVESKDEINILPDGTAEATNGQLQAYFPANIYNGVIEIVTPSGQCLQSRPIGLSYDDGTSTVLIAALTNSTGYLISSNQILYPNAFAGLAGDLRYTYTKSGFENEPRKPTIAPLVPMKDKH